MSNTLTKSYTYIPYTTTVMLSAAVAAYKTYESVYSCETVLAGLEGEWVWSTNSNTGVKKLVFITTSGSGGLYSSYVCTTRTVATYHAATAATYGTVTKYTKSYNLGWNAGGRSLASLAANGVAQFQASASDVGAIVGLKMGTSTDDYIGSDIHYAFYLHSGYAEMMHRGTVVATAGTFDASTVFQVQRVGATISWIKDGTVLATATGAPTGETWLEASLYSAGDIVESPTLTVLPVYAEIAIELPGLDMLLANYTYAAIDLALPPPVPALERSQIITIDLALPGLAMLLADYAYVGIDMALPVPVPALSTYTSITPSLVLLDVPLPTLEVSITAVRVVTAEIVIELPGLAMLLADFTYREVVLELPALQVELGAYSGAVVLGFASYEEEDTTLAQQRTVSMALVSQETESDALVVPTENTLALVVRETAQTILKWFTSAALAVKSLVTPLAQLETTDGEGATWVCSLDGAGSTTYGNFGFNSYARIGDHCFAAGDAGITLLEGDTDDGAPIQAAIGLGRLDFGAAQMKTVGTAYIAMAGAAMVLRVQAGGSTYSYLTRGAAYDGLQQRRVELGRGLRANYLDVDLFNKAGADFEVDALEFLVSESTRRI